MDYKERFSSNKVKLEAISRELNAMESRKRELIQLGAQTSGEQRLLQELMKEEKKDEPKP